MGEETKINIKCCKCHFVFKDKEKKQPSLGEAQPTKNLVRIIV